MKKTSIVFRLFITLAAGDFVGSRAAAQSSEPPEIGATNMIPQIIMDDVPLREAIRNLARQMGINYGLVLREDAASRSARIILKPERKADPGSRRGEN